MDLRMRRSQGYSFALLVLLAAAAAVATASAGRRACDDSGIGIVQCHEEEWEMDDSESNGSRRILAYGSRYIGYNALSADRAVMTPRGPGLSYNRGCTTVYGCH